MPDTPKLRWRLHALGTYGLIDRDPTFQLPRHSRGIRPFFAYSTNYLVDTDAGTIVDVEATTANRKDEVASSKTMVERVEKRFKLKPKRLIDDSA